MIDRTININGNRDIDMTQTILNSLFVFLAILSPVWIGIIIVFLVVFLDTGIAIFVKHKVAIKGGEKSPITSRKFGMVLIKLILFMVAILTGFGLDYFLIDVLSNIPGGIEWIITKLVTIVIVGQEVISIDESIRYGNKDKGLKYYLNTIFKALRYVKDKIVKLLKRV